MTLPAGRIVATYDYRDEEGRTLYQTARFDPKDFRQRRPDGQGGWIWNLSGVRRILYRLPELLASPRESLVFVVEGEKDAVALAALGLVATTAAMGAGKWRPEYNEALHARHVVLIPDNDDAGRKHILDVARCLRNGAASLRVLTLEGLPDRGDVSDWLALPGNDATRLLALAQGATEAPPVADKVAAAPAGKTREEWEPPLALDSLGAPVPFPVDVFPAPLVQYVDQVAWATNSPLDFVAVPVLALAAGCIGATRSLAITRSHVQPSTLFAVVIGLPGTGKSPALETVLDPLEEAESQYRRDHRAEIREWTALEPNERGPKPIPRRLIVDDATSEALMKVLAGNQRGLVMVRDELSALVAGFNQYKAGGKGADRQVYLKAWSAATIRVDRKTDGDSPPLIIRRPSLSIVGGVQPDVIRTFIASDENGRALDDGLLDRFLFSYPRDLPAVEEKYREVSEENVMAWTRAVKFLLDLKQWVQRDGNGAPDERGARPKIVKLTGEGRECWTDFTRQHASEINGQDFPDYLRGPWSKLRGYGARLALVLQFMQLAFDESTYGDDVTGASVRGAARLIGYFKAHYLRVAQRMGADPCVDRAKAILAWLGRNPEKANFSRRDAFRSLGASFSSPGDMSPALHKLVEYGYLRRLEVEPAPTGRRPGPHFEVNPDWDRPR